MNQKAIATLISVEADASNKLPERIHLLRTGVFETTKYGRLEITADDIREFVANYEAGIGRPGQDGSGYLPVNFGHDKGGKAAAWITKLTAEDRGNGIVDLYGTVEWTGSGKEAVVNKDYGFISSEFTPRCMGGFWSAAEDATRKVRNVFTGAALTNIPMFNGNKGITASSESTDSKDEKQVIYINASDEDKEHKMPTLDEVRVKDANSLEKEDKQVLANALVESQLSADEKKKFAPAFGLEASADAPQAVEASAVEGTEGLVAVEASEIKALKDRATAAEAKVEAAEAAKTDLEKRVEATEAEIKKSRRKEIEASVAEHVKRGAIVADQKDNWADRIEADASMEEMLKALPSNKVVEASNLGQDDKGEGAVSASDKVDAKAKELMQADTNLQYGDAVSQVLASDSALKGQLEAEQKAAVSGN